MAASRTIVVVSSSDDGRAAFPEVPAGTAVDPAPADPAVVAGAPVLGGAVVLAVGGTAPAGTDDEEGTLEVAVPGTPDVALPGTPDVALPGVVALPWSGVCAEAGMGVAAASAAQQIPAVRRRRRIRRHRLTETRPRPPTAPLTAARR
jgi:hypothetical protein